MSVANAATSFEEPERTKVTLAGLRRFLRHFSGAVGLVLLLLLIALALLGPLVAHDPAHQDVRIRLTGPSAAHWLGTDELGRDVFARIVFGARISLAAGLAAVAIGLVGGTLLGLAAGVIGGKVQYGIIAAVDVMLALPTILLAITIAARLGPGLLSAMIAAGMAGLPGFARLARAATLSIIGQEYVEASRATGATRFRIAFRHVLPNILTPMTIQATIGVGNAILLVSALGFLGLGAQPPKAEWGRMLADAQRYVLSNPSLGIFPGLAIAMTVLGFNLAGDGLRDTFDPRQRQR